MSCTPQSLMALAKCFVCPDHKIRQAIQTYLLCQWASAVTTFPPTAGQTRLVFLDSVQNGDLTIDLTNGPPITSIGFPNLVTVNGNLTIAGYQDPVTFNITEPTSVYLPLLQTITGTLTIGPTACASLDFPELVTAGSIDCSNNGLLSAVSFPNLVTVTNFHFDSTPLPHLDLPLLSSQIASFDGPVNCLTLSAPYVLPTNAASWEWQNSALDAASVNLLLARCVANPTFTGVLDLSGANAAPTGQGLIDKATLLGRGCLVTTN